MDTAQLSLVRTPFDDPDFLFELKHDGFRALAHIWDGKCELVSRRRNAYKSFNELRENLAKLKVKNAVIDGELVCLDSEGRSIFNELLFRRACPIFYAFDLLYLNDRDLRQRPLEIKNPHYTQSERRHELFETFKSKQTAQPPIPKKPPVRSRPLGARRAKASSK